MPNRAQPIETLTRGWLRRAMLLLALTYACLLAGCDGRETGTNEPLSPAQTSSDPSKIDGPADRASGSIASESAERIPCDHRTPHRNLFWGELHVHTSLSSDAWRSDVRATPDDAYRFATGEAITIPPLDDAGEGTQRIKLERPLDFAAVTDHAETLGALELCKDPAAPTYDSPGCDYYRRLPARPGLEADPDLPPALEVERMICGDDFSKCTAASVTPWGEITSAAERWNDTSTACRFTTFHAYEWSGARDGPLLHRNVIFRNERTPLPAGSRRLPRPWDLFRYLQSECLEAGIGCDVLAIPHNSNTSQGQMFVRDYPGAEGDLATEAEMARERIALEPIVEIMQHKGDSECRNGFANVLGGPDELCGFEKLFPAALPECREGQQAEVGDVFCTGVGGYARTGLALGLAEAARIGVNPFAVGFIAATDTHNANAGDVGEATWKGHVGTRDATPEARMSARARGSANTLNNPGGLAAVWAEENRRESIFDALRRRETYGTSGPRIAVRLFGGWDYPEDLCANEEFAQAGYDGGVPMGGVLGPAPAADAAPVFAVHAQADPGTAAHPGGLLQRAQIIKVWNDADGRIHQRVFDVAGDRDNGADVDPTTCRPRGPGERELCTVWRDPEFSASTPAVYYARIVENPSCRWQAWTCLDLEGEARPAACDQPERYPRTIQERAWTSPIWFEGQAG